ncbi:MAG: TauD/TfdA dioxygenase family protein [Acidimicrobiales bacterium]
MEARADTAAAIAGSIDVQPLTGCIGAVLGGVDLACLRGGDVASIRAALLAHRVVFFRDQELDSDSQIAFARQLGPLTRGHPTLSPATEHPEVHELDSAQGSQADYWHTDVTFVERPPAISVLRAVTLPSHGGDTLWASTVAGFKSLRPELRELAEKLDALHTNIHDYATAAAPAPSATADPAHAAHVAEFRSQRFETVHPVVRVHPETGEPALLLGGFASRILHYRDSLSQDLLRAFSSQVTSPDHCVRWSWRPGDVAMWDNRSTQHYAVFDYAPQRRQMQRVTVAGEVPVAVDGRPSVSLAGDASAYLPETSS